MYEKQSAPGAGFEARTPEATQATIASGERIEGSTATASPQHYAEAPLMIPGERVTRLVDSWLSGRSPRTIETYRQGLQHFTKWLGAVDVDGASAQLLALSHGEANAIGLDYRNWMIESGLAPATVNVRLAALRSLVALARRLGLVPWALEVERVKSRAYRDTAGPGTSVVRELLAAMKATAEVGDFKAKRDFAIVAMLAVMALRRGEVIGLDLADVDLASKRLWIVGKGKTEREPITIPSGAVIDSLAAWIAQRGSEPGPLFFHYSRSTAPGRLSGQGVGRMLATESLKHIGIRIRPHQLRHSAITTALDAAGGNYRVVRCYSRHADPGIVAVYDDARRDDAGAVGALVAGLVGL